MYPAAVKPYNIKVTSCTTMAFVAGLHELVCQRGKRRVLDNLGVGHKNGFYLRLNLIKHLVGTLNLSTLGIVRFCGVLLANMVV